MSAKDNTPTTGPVNPLKKHIRMTTYSDFVVAYCGHTRTHVEADRIKAQLPELWASAPLCDACQDLQAVARDLRVFQTSDERTRAHMVAQLIINK